MISLLFIILSAIMWAILQTLMWHPDTNILSKKYSNFWNPNYSYKNKYARYTGTDIPNLIMMKPRFFGSTTFLVWLTDGWHLVDKFFITFIMLAIVNYSHMTMYAIADFIIYYLVFTGVFELVWRLLKTK